MFVLCISNKMPITQEIRHGVHDMCLYLCYAGCNDSIRIYALYAQRNPLSSYCPLMAFWSVCFPTLSLLLTSPVE